MSKEIEKITDYNENLSLLIEQYKKKPNFKGIVESSNRQADDIEQAAFEIRDEFFLDTAIGVQLDTIGEIQDEGRQGETDEPYRDRIRVKVIVNNGSGEPETLISAMTGLFGATVVHLVSFSSATITMYVDVELTQDDFDVIERIIPSGVMLIAIYGTEEPFSFEGYTAGKGFGKLLQENAQFIDLSEIQFIDLENAEFLTNESDTNADAGKLQTSIQSAV